MADMVFSVVYNVCKVAVVLCLGCGLLMIYLKLDDSVHLSEPLGRNHNLLEKRSAISYSDLPSIVGSGYSTESNEVESFSQVWYNRSIDLIWVGGCPRSGTTLARTMLDAHEYIRCGEETHIIPLLIDFQAKLLNKDFMRKRMEEAKVTEDVLGDALAAYLLTVIWEHGDYAPRLCNKDPMVLNHMEVVLDLFPNSLFVFMARDGRAVCHSMISREINIGGFDTETYRGCLEDWNRLVERQYNGCMRVGSGKCRLQYYEQLVLHPEREMRELLAFLGVDWCDSVLHHTDEIGPDGKISLSARELSTDQVNKPVNTAALSKWVGHIPPDVIHDMDSIAPMLRRLGYDPEANPPNYGEPDDLVAKQSANLDLSEKHQRAIKSQQGMSDKKTQTRS